MNRGPHRLELDEGERQLVLLALAQLSLIDRGFDYALNLVALRIDNDQGGRAEMFDAFRASRADLVPAERYPEPPEDPEIASAAAAAESDARELRRGGPDDPGPESKGSGALCRCGGRVRIDDERQTIEHIPPPGCEHFAAFVERHGEALGMAPPKGSGSDGSGSST